MRAVFLLCLAVIVLPEVAAGAAPEVRAEPARVLLGRDTSVTLEVRVPEGSGPVRVAASSGTFSQQGVEDGPVQVLQWTPPDVRYPLAALLVFWVEGREGAPEVAVVRIPLMGRTDMPITTDPGAEVVVEIDGAHFGPVKANRRGKVQVPVEVPPGVKQARVLATRGALKTDRLAPIEVPPHQPLVAAVTPNPLPRSGGWLVVAGEGTVDASVLEFSPKGARLEPQEGAKDGSKEGAALLYRVSPEQGAEAFSVVVRRRNAKDTAQAQASILAEEEAVAAREEPSTPAPVMPSSPLAMHVLAGAFFAGGANSGPMAALGLSHQLPVWDGRLAVELEFGLRQASLEAQINGFGTLRSRVLAGPVLASGRAALFGRSAFTLYGRVGAGAMPFRHAVSSDFQPGFNESKVGLMAFVAAQGAYRFGRVSGLVELRGEYGPAHTSRLDAQLGGVGVSLGVRYEP
ncbi:MAG TPA: hypothetical protein VF815_33940 [Myxococcaceae bacterium]|jgi:hypothetical protein